MNFNEVPFVDKHYIVNFLGKFIGGFEICFGGLGFGGFGGFGGGAWVFLGFLGFWGNLVLEWGLSGIFFGVVSLRAVFFEKRRGNPLIFLWCAWDGIWGCVLFWGGIWFWVL